TPRPPSATLFPYTTLFRSGEGGHRSASVAEQEKSGLTAAITRPGRKHHVTAGGNALAKNPSEMEPSSPPHRLPPAASPDRNPGRSEEHTSELQSRENLVCR